MGKYIAERLERSDLSLIIEKTRIAVSKGWLSDDPLELAYMEKVRKSRDFEWFVAARNEALESYFQIQRDLEEALPKIEMIDDPSERFCQLFPLFETAMRCDDKLRAFVRSYQADDGMLQEFITDLTTLISTVVEQSKDSEAKEINVNLLVGHLISLHPRESYAVSEFRDMLTLLADLKGNNVQFDSNSDGLAITIKLFIDNNISPIGDRIAHCLRSYARESTTTLARKLWQYLPYLDKTEETLASLELKKEREGKQKGDAIATLTPLLSEVERRRFTDLLYKIDVLMTHEHIEDGLRGAVFDGLEDYFVREDIATVLCDLGVVSSPEPMDYPQHELLKIAREYYIQQCN